MRTFIAPFLSGLLCMLPVSACAQTDSSSNRTTNGDPRSETIQGPLQTLENRFSADWRRFRQRYISSDGRVIDTGNGGVSHSEGQGYAMLFAVAANDRKSFEELRRWTQQVLQRDDNLHFWRFDPNGEPQISDPNSAADGELLIAWALLRAAARWQDASYQTEARRILEAFETRLIRRIGRRVLIIPWDGADLDSPRVINPSYFVFPAMQDIAVAIGSKLWIDLYEDCLDLLQEARLGSWGLPPDWLAIDDDNNLTPWRERKPYFSYDAIRVPLHLAWAGHDSAEFLLPYLNAWQSFPLPRTPAWFNLLPGSADHAREAGPAGFLAVRALTTNIYQAAQQQDAARIPLPNVYSSEDYFSASLILLARLAEIDWWRGTAQPVTTSP